MYPSNQNCGLDDSPPIEWNSSSSRGGEGGDIITTGFSPQPSSTPSDEGSPYHKLGRGGRRTNCSDWISGLEGKGFKISERVDLILAK